MKHLRDFHKITNGAQLNEILVKHVLPQIKALHHNTLKHQIASKNMNLKMNPMNLQISRVTANNNNPRAKNLPHLLPINPPKPQLIDTCEPGSISPLIPTNLTTTLPAANTIVINPTLTNLNQHNNNGRNFSYVPLNNVLAQNNGNESYVQNHYASPSMF